MPRMLDGDPKGNSLIKVNINTQLEDEWEFSGNIHLGKTQFRTGSDGPSVALLEMNPEKRDVLAEELANFVPPAVELTQFKAEPEGQEVTIFWTSAHKPEVKAYIVEFSADQSHWLPIDTIGLRQEPGLHPYATKDQTPLEGSRYYRIRQMMEDGQEASSHPIALAILPIGNHLTYLYPNPLIFGTAIELNLKEAAKVQISILRADGKKLAGIYSRYTSMGRHLIELNMEDLPKGSYLCEIKVGEHNAIRKIRR